MNNTKFYNIYIFLKVNFRIIVRLWYILYLNNLKYILIILPFGTAYTLCYEKSQCFERH